jgi:hypothetical protein
MECTKNLTRRPFLQMQVKERSVMTAEANKPGIALVKGNNIQTPTRSISGTSQSKRPGAV